MAASPAGRPAGRAGAPVPCYHARMEVSVRRSACIACGRRFSRRGGDAPPSAQAIAARALDSARRHHCLPSPLSPPTLDPIITVVLARIPAAGAPTPAQLHHESAVSIPSLCSSDCAEAITDDDASSLLRPSAARQSSSTTKKKFLYSSCCPVYCLRRMCCSLRSLR